MVYVAWKYEKVMLLRNQEYKWHTRQEYRDCVIGFGCQCAQICSLTMFHVSHPYLVSLSFYTIPIYPILVREEFMWTFCTWGSE